MSYLFLEDGDLLESIELESVLGEVITETTIAGMKITKENLEDEDFVKDLIKKIKNYEYNKKDPNEVEKFLKKLLGIINIICLLTIVLIPVIFLLSVITEYFSVSSKSKRDLKKLDDCLEKTINKLKRQREKSKSKDKYDDAIKKLENNREMIYNRSKVISSIDIIDISKYDSYGNIKISNTFINTLVGDIIKTDVSRLDNKIKNTISKVNNWDDKFTNFEYLEQLAHYNIDNSKLLNYLNKYGSIGNASRDIFNNWEDNYLNNKYKKLVNKTLTHLYFVDGITLTYIVYCNEDSCCYAVNFDHETIDKITVQQLLQASKQSYGDLMKLIKEYENK